MIELRIPLIVSKRVAHKDAIFLMLDKLPVHSNNTWCNKINKSLVLLCVFSLKDEL